MKSLKEIRKDQDENNEQMAKKLKETLKELREKSDQFYYGDMIVADKDR